MSVLLFFFRHFTADQYPVNERFLEFELSFKISHQTWNRKAEYHGALISSHVLKETYFAFFPFLSFSALYTFLCMQTTLLLKCPTSNPTFICINLWHHSLSQCRTSAYLQFMHRCWFWTQEFIQYSCYMCELTNQRRLSIWEAGPLNRCVCFRIKACKATPVVTQNSILNL